MPQDLQASRDLVVLPVSLVLREIPDQQVLKDHRVHEDQLVCLALLVTQGHQDYKVGPVLEDL